MPVAAMVVLAISIVIVGLVKASTQGREGFVDARDDKNSKCPKEAWRGPDGRIHIKPGTQTFATLSDYVGYLGDLYTKGATCVPPKVRPLRDEDRTPLPGIFGGLGVGAESPDQVARQGASREVLNTEGPEMTSAKTPINKLDDYEYTRVFQENSQRRNPLSTETTNQLMNENILDWAKLPFISESREKQEDEFVAGRMESGFREPKSGIFFDILEGKGVEPPDVEAAKLREQKILATYRPTDVSTHIVDSETEAVGKLVHKVYENDPNWEPVVVKTGENQYQVSELRPKARKERYEDDSTMSLAMAETRGVYKPEPKIDIADRMSSDPFFEGGVADKENDRFWQYKDFTKWTPGLERMFAPTVDKRNWY